MPSSKLTTGVYIPMQGGTTCSQGLYAFAGLTFSNQFLRRRWGLSAFALQSTRETRLNKTLKSSTVCGDKMMYAASSHDRHRCLYFFRFSHIAGILLLLSISCKSLAIAIHNFGSRS